MIKAIGNLQTAGHSDSASSTIPFGSPHLHSDVDSILVLCSVSDGDPRLFRIGAQDLTSSEDQAKTCSVLWFKLRELKLHVRSRSEIRGATLTSAKRPGPSGCHPQECHLSSLSRAASSESKRVRTFHVPWISMAPWVCF